jgi:hypothetical protein
MTAALIVFTVFVGIALVVGVVASAILLADGKLTLPNTNARRVMHARAMNELSRLRLEDESMQMRIDDAIQLRLTRTVEGPRDPGKEVTRPEDPL